MDTAAPPPAWQLMPLMDGFLTTQLLYVAAKLGVADVLSEGPRRNDDIADAVGADPAVLLRVLRGLAVEGVLDEQGDGRFGLTAVGAALVPLRGAALVRGELYYRSAAGLLDTVLGGGPAFAGVHGETFFEHLDRHPEADEVFQASMAGRSQQEAAGVVGAYDFSGLRTLVDVGGGGGILLAAILRAAPTLHGVLLDRAGAIPAARARLAEEAVSDRATCLAGDFFTDLPAGADAYLLSRILHDWDDDDARRLLAACRDAMGPDGRVLLVDAVLPERAVDAPAAIRMDLHMLLLFGARERTEAEFHELLRLSGLRLERVAPIPSPTGLAVIEARSA